MSLRSSILLAWRRARKASSAKYILPSLCKRANPVSNRLSPWRWSEKNIIFCLFVYVHIYIYIHRLGFFIRMSHTMKEGECTQRKGHMQMGEKSQKLIRPGFRATGT